ncbi:type I-C CRISPR-associated protein Cas8c/Csd1 [Nonomuraea longicatena]|uniref:Type I-C CRISPR-associated protein Cas8c/Csd1 n=1 Tax=Nonomuraea longicatena TaxID=83682 RepID=A0ABP3Z972_9ACTN
MSLLRRLVEQAQDPGRIIPPYYQDKPVKFVLELNSDGSPASPYLTSLVNPADPRTKSGVVHTVPSIVKTVNIAPTLAVDTGEYLFGWVDAATKNPARVERMHRECRELVDQWVAADPDGPGLPLRRFLTGGHVREIRRDPDWSRDSRIAVRVDGTFLHDTQSAREFWQVVASRQKSSGRSGLCLVCGLTGPLLQSIPQQLPARLVPKATQQASLVSINRKAHGFDLQKQLVHTPICASCALRAMDTLERLLNDQWSGTVVGQDTRLIWWTTGATEFDLYSLFDPPTPRLAAHLLLSAAAGRAPTVGDEVGEESFCAVAIGGNVSRVVVRQWIEQPLPRIKANLEAWATDLAMFDGWSGEVRQPGLRRLVAATGRWIVGKNGAKGGYAKVGAPGADRPPDLYGGLLRSALLAAPLPPKLLAHLIRRIGADGRVDLERAALLRLALRRRLPDPERELYMPNLNPDNNQPAYLSGRIFAVLEDIQLSAARADGDAPPNTTFADKYWSRATTSPAAALMAGSDSSRAWLRRMRRKQPGWAQGASRRLDELYGRLAQAGGPPHGTNLAEKTAFVLGYHQQCDEQFAARKAAAAKKRTDDNPSEQGESA